MLCQHRLWVACPSWQADLWSCLERDCGTSTLLNNNMSVCRAQCSGGEHLFQPPTIIGYVNTRAFILHPWVFSVPQRTSLNSSVEEMPRWLVLTARPERTWRQMINLSFASCNKWQAFGKFWRADERNNTRGRRDTEKFWCTVVSYQFILLFFFHFWLLWAVKGSWRHSFCSAVFFCWSVGRHCCSKVQMPETVFSRV
jgi:hypothetical protein